ncbi:hypothetical protein RUND412_003476, partial [Rhizina undulata]
MPFALESPRRGVQYMGIFGKAAFLSAGTIGKVTSRQVRATRNEFYSKPWINPLPRKGSNDQTSDTATGSKAEEELMEREPGMYNPTIESSSTMAPTNKLHPGLDSIPDTIDICQFLLSYDLCLANEWTCFIDNCILVTTPGLPGYKMIEDHLEENRIKMEKAMKVIWQETVPKELHHLEY